MMDRVIIHFDRLDDGTLVAIHTHEGRTVAAIVHPGREVRVPYGDGYTVIIRRRWSLAGDIHDISARPCGSADLASLSCAEAAHALGIELGIDVVGYEVTP